jgi:hypothetical protein
MLPCLGSNGLVPTPAVQHRLAVPNPYISNKTQADDLAPISSHLISNFNLIEPCLTQSACLTLFSHLFSFQHLQTQGGWPVPGSARPAMPSYHDAAAPASDCSLAVYLSQRPFGNQAWSEHGFSGISSAVSQVYIPVLISTLLTLFPHNTFLHSFTVAALDCLRTSSWVF